MRSRRVIGTCVAVAAVLAACAGEPATQAVVTTSRPASASIAQMPDNVTTVAPVPEAMPADAGTPTAVAAALPRAAPGTALALLATLKTRGRGPKTGYSRERFGETWIDIDGDGCDTRQAILRRDLRGERRLAGCEIVGGILVDPYTGRRLRFASTGLDIDHVVALVDAWQSGAARFRPGKRLAFANDPLNLVAVSIEANRTKGGGNAASWLPPRKSFRCRYAALQVAVKARYGLSVTPPEREALERILSGCPRLKTPRGGLRKPFVTLPATAKPATTGIQALAGAPPRHFPRCAEVRAAGLAPLRRGTALYAENDHLDGDDDGLACE